MQFNDFFAFHNFLTNTFLQQVKCNKIGNITLIRLFWFNLFYKIINYIILYFTNDNFVLVLFSRYPQIQISLYTEH